MSSLEKYHVDGEIGVFAVRSETRVSKTEHTCDQIRMHYLRANLFQYFQAPAHLPKCAEHLPNTPEPNCGIHITLATVYYTDSFTIFVRHYFHILNLDLIQK